MICERCVAFLRNPSEVCEVVDVVEGFKTRFVEGCGTEGAEGRDLEGVEGRGVEEGGVEDEARLGFSASC